MKGADGMASDSTSEICAIRLEGSQELLQLEAEWAALWARCPEATPFQSPDWLIPFWTHLGEGQLLVIAIREYGRLVGLAPFSIYTEPVNGERQLFLLGTGVSDYLDVLFEPGFETRCAALVSELLERSSDTWDVCDFQQLRSGCSLLQHELPAGWTGQINVQEVCPGITLPESLSDLPAHVTPRMLEKLRYYRQRLQKLAPWSIELARLDDFEAAFNRFLQLHQARWIERGQHGVLLEERMRRFHRECAYRMLLRGTLRLYALECQGSKVGCLYAFAHGDQTYYYLSGFDPAYAPYSPGTLLIGHAIEEAVKEGRRVFDFLRGREAYKYMWGAKGRLNFRRQLRHHHVARLTRQEAAMHDHTGVAN